MLILFPAYCNDPLSLSPTIAKTRYTQYHKQRSHICTFLFHLNCVICTVSPEILIFSYPLCFELSAFALIASMVITSYYCPKLAATKTLPAAPVDNFYWTSIIFFLTFLFLRLYANLFLVLQAATWRLAQLLCLCQVHMHLHSLEEARLHNSSIKPLQKWKTL